MDFSKFLSPPKEYRTSPFWSWNDLLTGDELRWQIQQMKEQGFGGFFMHAREGLRTPYMSEEWLELINTAVDEAKKLDMEAWLYDEDRWPSGCAGGLVTAKSDAYKAKYLLMQEIPASEVADHLSTSNVIAVHKVELADKKILSSARITDTKNLQADERAVYLAFQVFIQKPTVNSNGHGYIDVLNPEAVAEFIKVTHEQYKAQVGEHFGTTIPGIFADEPTYRSKEADSIPWSQYLPTYFREEHGYELADHLPALFYESTESTKIKYDFVSTLTKKFVECFTKPLYDWCTQNYLQLTGHLLSEDTMTKQTNAIGAAMPHYRYMHLPGIDHLGTNISDPLTLKQCASVGHQFGITRLLCEIFGVGGHAMTFADQKWIADYHIALGITFFSQHLTLYSMIGQRKRDYPPTFSYHQPYWQDYHLINDYLARASYFASQGKYLCETLVLHPMGSVWATFSRTAGKANSSRYDDDLIKLQNHLFAAQIPFDYGDEFIMEESAKIVTKDDKSHLQIGDSHYRTVIIPPSLTWSKSTYQLMYDFVQQGGQIIMQAPVPTMIGGVEALLDWEQLLNNPNVSILPDDKNQLMTLLNTNCYQPLKLVIDGDGFSPDILTQVRADGTNYTCFIANTSRTLAHEVSLTIPNCKYVYQLNLHTGQVTEVACKHDSDSNLQFDTTIHPCGSAAYLMTVTQIATAKEVETFVDESWIALPNKWDFVRKHSNSLTLDYCSYSANEGEWSELLPVWQVRKALWRQAGISKMSSIQPWVVESDPDFKSTQFPIKMRFGFECEYLPAQLYLVAENADQWQLQVNNRPINTVTAHYQWDKCFSKIDISGAIVKGHNQIELTAVFQYGLEVEDLYLVGDFGVRKIDNKKYVLTTEPTSLVSGSWVEQDYPFYAGNMIYKSTFTLQQIADGKRLYLRLHNPVATLLKITVNNKQTHQIISEPWEVDITNDCLLGENQLAIEVVGSLRNIFGPLHHSAKSPAWCGPNQFVDTANWVDDYQFEDYGLLEGASLVVKTQIG